MKRDHPKYIRARAACRKIMFQFPSYDSDKKEIFNPEEKLMYAIIERAILDLLHRKHNAFYESAMTYLFDEDIKAATLCGINSQWIQSVIVDSKMLED